MMREGAKGKRRVLRTISESQQASGLQTNESQQRPSQETLVNARAFPRVDSEDTLVESRTMSSPSSSAAQERRRSYGIGGAGNMRLPSMVKAAEEAIDNAVEGTDKQERRTSAWSLASSGSSRKGSIVDKIFRRGSKADESSGSPPTT